MLRGFLLTTGAGAAVVLAAGSASAAGLSVTPTYPANPTTETPLTWDITTTDGSPTSCELDLGATVVSPLTDCAKTKERSGTGGVWGGVSPPQCDQSMNLVGST